MVNQFGQCTDGYSSGKAASIMAGIASDVNKAINIVKLACGQSSSNQITNQITTDLLMLEFCYIILNC